MTTKKPTPLTGPYGLLLGACCWLLTSCAVQNNLYLNNPVPLPRGEAVAYGGASAGIRPVIDSTDVNGFTYYSDVLQLAPMLNLGVNVGLTNRVGLGVDVHLPYGFAGFGMNVRPQISFFPASSGFNVALSGRAGFAISSENLQITNNISIYIGDLQDVRGTLNASLALPMSVRMGEDTYLFITPRWSRTSFAIWDNTDFRDRVYRRGYTFPILSIGARLKNVHIEGTVIKKERGFLPTMGVVYVGGA